MNCAWKSTDVTCRIYKFTELNTIQIYIVFSVIIAIISILVGKCICTMKTFDFSLFTLFNLHPSLCVSVFHLLSPCLYHYLNIAATATIQSGSNKQQLCMKIESTELFTIYRYPIYVYVFYVYGMLLKYVCTYASPCMYVFRFRFKFYVLI